jgi:S1-C subfamily serine protease
VITRLNGGQATSLALSALQLSAKVGDQIPVEYVRDGQRGTATITLAEQPS